MIVYYEAKQSQRINSIADGFNLWGKASSKAWINYATAMSPDALEKSKEQYPHITEWRVIKGYRERDF